jgi:Fe-S oxidoreductase
LKLCEIIAGLRDEIEAGTPIVGIEPLCVSVFKEELPNLFPQDQDALRLSSLVTPLGDFLAGLEHWMPSRIERPILLHGHCHHKAVIGMAGTQQALEKVGADAKFIDAGCCC